MDFGGYPFKHVCDITPVMGGDGFVQALMPQGRCAKRDLYPLNKYGTGPFCKFRIPATYPYPGVYLLTVGDEIQYIGETTHLSRRYNMGYGTISPRNCYKGGQETNVRMNNLIYQAALSGEIVSLWFYRTEDFKTIELGLRRQHRSSWNRV
ncbi:GIY-YIG nuclease family protein [Agrobacterium tumefaciens]|uniref:GIY-YIG nuclease family protein n=1 Tax=Agrobacterium tumefaciens TaxID=358 RepID=UPI000EF25025|nr:hypothetical protein At1D1108_26670 [Agrobacterium tumefaciens]NSY91447.1 GIY-YIG nuclease family protein [Agrobacterium tumefaciens]